MLIDQDGNKQGMVSIDEAIKKAAASSMDLFKLLQMTPSQ